MGSYSPYVLRSSVVLGRSLEWICRPGGLRSADPPSLDVVWPCRVESTCLFMERTNDTLNEPPDTYLDLRGLIRFVFVFVLTVKESRQIVYERLEVID